MRKMDKVAVCIVLLGSILVVAFIIQVVRDGL